MEHQGKKNHRWQHFWIENRPPSVCKLMLVHLSSYREHIVLQHTTCALMYSSLSQLHLHPHLLGKHSTQYNQQGCLRKQCKQLVCFLLIFMFIELKIFFYKNGFILLFYYPCCVNQSGMEQNIVSCSEKHELIFKIKGVVIQNFSVFIESKKYIFVFSCISL